MAEWLLAWSLAIYEYKYTCTHTYTHIFFGSLSPLPYCEFHKDRGYFTFFVVRSKLVQFRTHEIIVLVEVKILCIKSCIRTLYMYKNFQFLPHVLCQKPWPLIIFLLKPLFLLASMVPTVPSFSLFTGHSSNSQHFSLHVKWAFP